MRETRKLCIYQNYPQISYKNTSTIKSQKFKRITFKLQNTQTITTKNIVSWGFYQDLMGFIMTLGDRDYR